MNCQAGAGVVVNISLASGAFLGSCTTGDPIATPWDTSISLCSVEGLPFNADLVATQDPSTVPAGYEPFEGVLSLHVDDLIPGGGDQATFTFFNVRTNTGSTNPTGSTSTANGSATLLMTFRGCPEGFNPEWDDFFAECTIPLDAPDTAFLDYHGEGQGGYDIAFMDRLYNGEYVYEAPPTLMNVDLYGLAPVVRDTYQVIGADGVNGSIYTINLVDGETREVYVFYYFYP